MGDQPQGQAPDNDLLMRIVAAFVAVFVVVAVVGAIVAFTVHTVPQENREIILSLLGSLTLAFGTIIGYLFGRSSASDLRTRADANAARTSTTTTTSVSPAPTTTTGATP